MPSVAVVTATTGRESLRKTIDSVKSQSVKCQHYIFADGVDVLVPADFGIDENIHWCRLPVKTGGNGMMNGGIMAASAYLVTEDLICWLDDDNWFDPNHIETLIEAKGDKPYAHSLRKLIDGDGSFFDYDDFESLGVYSGFIDLNCYLMDRKLAVNIAALWYQTTGEKMVGDRYVYAFLDQKKYEYGETGKYTVNYKMNDIENLKPWIFDGNIKNRAQYSGDLPWRK